MRSGTKGRSDGSPPPDRGERGAALVVVLIFGVGSMSLVTLLLTLTQSSLKHETDRHRRKALQTVLFEGVSLAFRELQANTYAARNGLTAEEIDPAGDGVGALIRTRYQDGSYAPDASTPAHQQGVEISDGAGTSLGFARAVVAREQVDGQWQRVLLVAAASPDFLSPRRAVISTKLLIGQRLPPWLSNRQAFSVVGDSGGASDTAANLTVAHSAELTITSTDRGVPAVNITDSTWHEKFMDAAASGGKTSISGSDADGNIVAGEGTIFNAEAGVVDTQLAADMTAALDQLARDVMRSENGHTGVDLKQYLQDTYQAWGDTNGDGAVDYADITDTISGGPYALPEGEYYLSSATTSITGSLSGSGNLILAGDVNLKGSVEWDGNLVVTHERTESEGTSAQLTLQNGSRLAVGANDSTSVLAVNSGDSNDGGELVSLTTDSGSRLDVNGVLLTTASTTNTEIIDSGAQVTVDGIALMIGDGIDYTVRSGGGWNVSGSMVFATPDGSTSGADIDIRAGSHSEFHFDNTNFESGLTTFEEFVKDFGLDTQTFPISLAAYVEAPSFARTLEALVVDDTAGLGYLDLITDQEPLP